MDNKLHSEQDMMQLHKEFKGVSIYDLKFVYRVFAGDLNVCREFLIVRRPRRRSTTMRSGWRCTSGRSGWLRSQ